MNIVNEVRYWTCSVEVEETDLFQYFLKLSGDNISFHTRHAFITQDEIITSAKVNELGEISRPKNRNFNVEPNLPFQMRLGTDTKCLAYNNSHTRSISCSRLSKTFDSTGDKYSCKLDKYLNVFWRTVSVIPLGTVLPALSQQLELEYTKPKEYKLVLLKQIFSFHESEFSSHQTFSKNIQAALLFINAFDNLSSHNVVMEGDAVSMLGVTGVVAYTPW